MLSRMNRIGGIADDFISGLRSPKTSMLPFTLRPVTTSTHSAFPLRLVNERALLIVCHRSDGYKHRWGSSLHRPLHAAETSRRQFPIGVTNIQLDRHRSRIQVHIVRDSCNRCVKYLTGICRNGKRDLLAAIICPHMPPELARLIESDSYPRSVQWASFPIGPTRVRLGRPDASFSS